MIFDIEIHEQTLMNLAYGSHVAHEINHINSSTHKSHYILVSLCPRQRGHRDGDMSYKNIKLYELKKSNWIKITIRDTNNTT